MAVDNNTILRCAVRWRFDTVGDIVNVYDLRVSETVFDGNLTDVRAGVGAYFTFGYVDAGLLGLMTNRMLHADIAIFDVTHNSPLGYTGRIASLDGTGGSEAMPPGVGCLLLMRTLVSRKVGRKYMGGFMVNYVNDGRWDTGVVTATQDWGDWLLTEYDTGLDFGLQYVVLTSGALPADTPVSRYVSDIPSYQRRRRQGTGS